MSLDETFAALADPTRRSILSKLEGGELTLSQLAEPLPMSLMAVQKHVQALESAGLVETRKIGRSRYVRLRPRGLDPITDWLQRAERQWNTAFDRLAAALEEEDT